MRKTAEVTTKLKGLAREIFVLQKIKIKNKKRKDNYHRGPRENTIWSYSFVWLGHVLYFWKKYEAKNKGKKPNFSSKSYQDGKKKIVFSVLVVHTIQQGAL